MKKIPIAVMVSGNGSNLQAILNFESDSNCLYKVVYVVSNRPDAFGLQRAGNANIPVIIWDKNTHPTLAQFEEYVALILKNNAVEWVALAGYMRMVGAGLLGPFAGRIINIHPSLLPNFPGLDTHQRAWQAFQYNAQNNQHGCTIHYVDNGLDSGEIIAQSALTITQGDTPASLQTRVHKLEHALYPLILNELCSNKA